ncbi:hypothetical protein ACI2KH_22205, partial [Roseomonas mucosa]|uniref:hypothetical protein n=1 Tax=Roseomonas mucosa TaxID=207340 RepID=UPI0038513A15
MTGFLTPGITAPGAAPAGVRRFAGRLLVSDLPDLPAVYLAELGSQPAPSTVRLAPLGTPGALAPGATPWPRATSSSGAVIRVSDRGWIGEPDDAAMPNVAYGPRLAEAPKIERTIRILPEDSARNTVQAGELTLLNADGALDVVGGEWTLAGRPVVIRRGPHRRPTRAAFAEFGLVANLRATSAPMGTDRLTVGLTSAASDLAVPACATYAGTGDIEGDSGLAGQNRPALYGFKRQIQPVTLLAGDLVYQVSSRPLAGITGVRDRGAPLDGTADHPTLAALLAATVPPSHFATSFAQGLIRLGSTPGGQVTVDAAAQGDGSHGGICLDLLRGPGGLTDDRIAPSGFLSALPSGQAGFLFTSGTVADALDMVTGACAGWWGSDRLGRIVAGRLLAPESMGVMARLERWMLAAEPQEVADTAPRWRQRVGYRALATVQSATDLVGIASEDPAAVAAYGTASQTATAYDTAIAQAYPAATDPEPLVSGFENAADAQALADVLLALHGTRRRRWTVHVGRYGSL